MKSFKKKSLSLLIVCSIVFSFCNTNPGIFSFWKKKAAAAKTSKLTKVGYGLGFLGFAGSAILLFLNSWLKGGFGFGQDEPPVNPQLQVPQGTDKEEVFKEEDIVIPDALVPYVQDSKKHWDIEYIQYKTINQFKNSVNKHVRDKFAASDYKDQDYSPNATCPSLAFRNAYIMDLLLRNAQSTNNNIEQKFMLLDVLNSADHAAGYLKRLADADKKTSWLSVEDFADRLDELGMVDRVSIVESVDDFTAPLENYVNPKILQQVLRLREVPGRFQDRENYYHTFIVNTGDTYYGMHDARDDIERDLGKLDVASFGRVWQSKSSECHWYAVSVVKQGGQYQCFITDTVPADNHIDTEKFFFYRNRYLAEMLVHGRSAVNFREARKEYGEDILRRNIANGDITLQVLADKAATQQKSKKTAATDSKKKAAMLEEIADTPKKKKPVDAAKEQADKQKNQKKAADKDVIKE